LHGQKMHGQKMHGHMMHGHMMHGHTMHGHMSRCTVTLLQNLLCQYHSTDVHLSSALQIERKWEVKQVP
jgi:stalled ribosome rescue protein Dom34